MASPRKRWPNCASDGRAVLSSVNLQHALGLPGERSCGQAAYSGKSAAARHAVMPSYVGCVRAGKGASQQVVGGTVEVVTAAVVATSGPRVSVTEGVLHVLQGRSKA